ncbi:recombinase family protein [Janibacter melonis]|uniref:recombinase family protein n=1 Tax=Janibacter melonis TaxID=262209 RepID=UPI0035578F16
MKPRAAIYCRISESDLHVDKPENQLRDCKRLCDEAGYEVVATYRDDGVSAYKKGVVRPQYERMKEELAAGAFDVLVAVAQDRLTREKWEPYLLAQTCDEHGVRWHTVAEGVIDFETDTMGGVRVGFTGSQNTAESQNKSRRATAANAHRRAAGLPISGPRPFGFEVDRIRHRQDEADEIRWAYSVILGGGSLYAVLKEWNARGCCHRPRPTLPTRLHACPQRSAAVRRSGWPSPLRWKSDGLVWQCWPRSPGMVLCNAAATPATSAQRGAGGVRRSGHGRRHSRLRSHRHAGGLGGDGGHPLGPQRRVTPDREPAGCAQDSRPVRRAVRCCARAVALAPGAHSPSTAAPAGAEQRRGRAARLGAV